jgi:cell division topological specificity factor
VRLLDFFRLGRAKGPPSASLAKQRLQVLIAHEGRTGGPDFMPLLQQELIEVIGKYVQIDPAKVKIELERQADMSVLEVNIELPAGMRSRAAV